MSFTLTLYVFNNFNRFDFYSRTVGVFIYFPADLDFCAGSNLLPMPYIIIYFHFNSAGIVLKGIVFVSQLLNNIPR